MDYLAARMYCSHTYHCLNHLHSLLSYLDDCPGDVHHPLLGHLLQNIVNGDESPSATHTSTVQGKQKVKHNIKTWPNKVIDYIPCNIWCESTI